MGSFQMGAFTINIPTHEKWMGDTKLGIRHPRNHALTQVDKALLEYEKANKQSDRATSKNKLWDLKTAFENWKRQEQDWETSPRNHNDIITNLNKELSKPPLDYGIYRITHGPKDSKAYFREQKAYSLLYEERGKVIEKLFAGKRVTLKDRKGKGDAEDAQWYEQEVKPKLEKARKEVRQHTAHEGAKEKVEETWKEAKKEIFSLEGLETGVEGWATIQELVETCGKEIAPVLSVVKDGAEMVVHWIKAGRSLYDNYAIAERRYSIDTGAPAAAFQGLQRCLKEELKQEAISAARATTAFAIKTALTFADGGALSTSIVGALSSVAEFTRRRFERRMEVKATQGANNALRKGELDIRLFSTYPLMGCYLLMCATLSDIIPMDSFATPGWSTDWVNALKNTAIDHIYSSAERLIDSSKFEIIGMPKRPIAKEQGLLSLVSDNLEVAGPVVSVSLMSREIVKAAISK